VTNAKRIIPDLAVVSSDPKNETWPQNKAHTAASTKNLQAVRARSYGPVCGGTWIFRPQLSYVLGDVHRTQPRRKIKSQLPTLSEGQREECLAEDLAKREQPAWRAVAWEEAEQEKD
jgi:hypothetical protein